jgi:hypothetical protein
MLWGEKVKIFNVSLHVRITQIAQIPDNPPEPAPAAKEPFNDDPLDKQEKIMNKYLDRMAEIQGPRGGTYASEAESASMRRSVKIQAETFEELSDILRKFDQLAKSLPPVDESLLKVATFVAPPAFNFGQ